MMRRGNPVRQRLTALALFAIPLLTYPLLGLPEGRLAGLPAVFVWLFGVWAVLVACAAWMAERRS